jgi:hypothetical protein
MVWMLLFAALAVLGFYYDYEIASRTFLEPAQVRQLCLVIGGVLVAFWFGFSFWKG